eukprot:8259737-Pyramimonas_sp.AAC.1
MISWMGDEPPVCPNWRAPIRFPWHLAQGGHHSWPLLGAATTTRRAATHAAIGTIDDCKSYR